MRHSTILLIFLAVLICGTCSGCQAKFTRPRYETIHLGMQDREVRSILGEPTDRTNGTWFYVNQLPYYKATIRFEDSRVKETRWSYEKPKGDYSP